MLSLNELYAQSCPLAGAPGAQWLEVDDSGWQAALTAFAAAGGRLFALWAETLADQPDCLFAAMLAEPGLLLLSLRLPVGQREFPSAHLEFPAALRMERAVFDLHGLRSSAWDQRRWLRHAAWPEDQFPLRDRVESLTTEPPADTYPFVAVDGEGVHEIAVGPVHAGIIEPGHFRFSVVGEKVLRLEQHLGYVHKGIEKRFTELPLFAGQRLAARVSGDSAVAFSWAYAQAVEGICATDIPPRAAWLRALALELERCANHLGDLGALGNDAGFGFALSQFGRLKEQWLRLTAAVLGQRYLLDLVVPGGTAVDADSNGLARLLAALPELLAEIARLHEILDEHAGVRDRFSGTGVVLPELAQRLGLTGLAGRASGQAFDLRVDLPCAPYAELGLRKSGWSSGDVAARVGVRFDELVESVRLIGLLGAGLPAGPYRIELPAPAADVLGLGCVEGWRGPVLVALRSGPDGSIARCHPHDPSWANWPVLEHAVIGNIVPDFPLINKSFNLSYSGHDL